MVYCDAILQYIVIKHSVIISKIHLIAQGAWFETKTLDIGQALVHGHDSFLVLLISGHNFAKTEHMMISCSISRDGLSKNVVLSKTLNNGPHRWKVFLFIYVFPPVCMTDPIFPFLNMCPVRVCISIF